MTMPSNSRTCSSPNEPRSTHSTPSNTRPTKSSSKNTSKLVEFPLSSPPKQCCFALLGKWKLGNYTPAKTISTSIAIWSRMPIPSPSSLTLSTNSKDHQSSSNSTYDGNTTMFSSNQRTWKATFTTPLGLFELNVMFIRMYNFLATFQVFMNDLFRDYSDSKNPFHTNSKYDAWSTTPYSVGIPLSLGGDISGTYSWLPNWSLGHVMWPTAYGDKVNLKQQLLCIAYKGDSILNYLTWAILTGRSTSVKHSVS